MTVAPPRTATDSAVSYLPHMRRPANWITLGGLAAGLAAGLAVVSHDALWVAAVLIVAAMAATARLALYLVRGHQPVNRGLPCPPAGVALVALAAAGVPAGGVLAAAVALCAAMLAPFPVPVSVALKELSHAPDANPLAGHPAAGAAHVSR